MVFIPNKQATFTRIVTTTDNTGNVTAQDTWTILDENVHAWRTSPSPYLVGIGGLEYDWAVIYDTDLAYPTNDDLVHPVAIGDRISFEDIPGHRVKGTIISIHTSWALSTSSTTAYFKQEGQ